MENNGKAYSFLISALITAFSFILMVAIVVSVFASSVETAHHSENKTLALNLAQGKIGDLQAEIAAMTPEEGAELVGEEVLAEEEVVIQWKGEDRNFTLKHSIAGEAQTNGVLLEISVQVWGENLKQEAEQLLELTTAIYKN